MVCLFVGLYCLLLLFPFFLFVCLTCSPSSSRTHTRNKPEIERTRDKTNRSLVCVRLRFLFCFVLTTNCLFVCSFVFWSLINCSCGLQVVTANAWPNLNANASRHENHKIRDKKCKYEWFVCLSVFIACSYFFLSFYLFVWLAARLLRGHTRATNLRSSARATKPIVR